jgi:tetratricopeptide (TPR) repeat protein
MVRHLVYFEVLGSLPEKSDRWRRVFAGLVVLRLIDIARSESRAGVAVDAVTVSSVRASVDALKDSDALKPLLSSVVDAIESGPDVTALCEPLVAYARALDLEASWRLASDVLETVVEIAPADTHPIAIDANTMLGGVARRAGDWDRSAAGYASAAHAAAVIGDTSRALKAEIGIANTHVAHGNLPAAERTLAIVVEEAKQEDLSDILELALHDRSTVAYNRRHFADALQFAYDALELNPSGTERDALLGDMGTIFAELGMRDAARDAHLIVSATSQSQWLVAQARINLMELASMDGMEDAFHEHAGSLSSAVMDVRHRAFYLLYLGQGYQRFGKLDAAARSLEEARTFATANGVHQVTFEAESALSRLAQEWATWPTVAQPASLPNVPESALRIARELTQMRELALATP